jgi:hypothetical protein
MHNIKDVAVGLTIAVMATNIIKEPEHSHYHTHQEPGYPLQNMRPVGVPVYGYIDPRHIPGYWNFMVPTAVGFTFGGVKITEV